MLKVVHVQWDDPCFASSGWMNLQDFEDWIARGPAPSDSIGILAYECPAFIVLLQSIGDNQVAEAIKITRSAIRSIKELSEIPVSLKLTLSGS